MIAAALILPAREMYAASAQPGSDADHFALALAEARTLARPGDGAAVDDLSRRLGAAGEKDWAIEVALRGAAAAGASPTAWRAVLAVSVAYVERLDVVPGLEFANRALAACKEHPDTCPEWEKLRVELYQQHLDAGVRSGIDPHRGPEAAKAFRKAGESSLRQIHLGGHEVERAPAHGSGAGAAPAGAGSAAGAGNAPQ